MAENGPERVKLLIKTDKLDWWTANYTDVQMSYADGEMSYTNV